MQVNLTSPNELSQSNYRTMCISIWPIMTNLRQTIIKQEYRVGYKLMGKWFNTLCNL